jgi:hypothetical protein
LIKLLMTPVAHPTITITITISNAFINTHSNSKFS